MKKHILLISTFILSFILLAGNVNAEDNIRLSCLYDGNKSGLFSAQGTTLITQTESGDVNVYYTKEPFINRNDLYNYPITSPIFINTKRTKKGHLEKTGENNIGEQLKEKGCPKYLDYNTKNIYYTYDTPKDDSEKRSSNSFYSYYPLISEDIPKENTPSKELRCEYPKLAYQKEFIITQSKDGKITTTYDGKEKKVNFSNDEESNTGYNVKTGKFDKCPFCVNVHNDYADFYNGESDASCKNSYSGLVDSNNTDWKFTCVYGTAREYTFIKEITLSYNENNFEITFTSPNSNVDPSHIINKFIAAQLWESNSNSCPSHLNLDTPGGELSYLYLESDKGIRYTLISHSSSEDPPSPEPEPEPTNCKDLFGEEVTQVINDVMKIIRLVVPILLIILGITDFFRATFSDSEEGMKKDRDRFIKRIIAAIIVFIVPFFVNLILKIANNVWSDINADTCVTEQK